jgi:hypothetical protein
MVIYLMLNGRQDQQDTVHGLLDLEIHDLLNFIPGFAMGDG